MKFVYAILIGAVAATVGSFAMHVYKDAQSKPKQEISQAEMELKKIKDQEANDERLGQYAVNMMYAAGAGKSLSDAKKLILARSIVRVANDIFETDEAKKGFVTVLAIESAFNRFAQSPTGPKGYGQLAKASFHEAVKDCGLKDAHDEDVWETDLNLYAAACYFTKMMAASNNDPYLAIVYYNQGPNSEAGKQYAKYGTMDNIEALKYVAKFNFLTRKVTDEKTKNVPTMKELPAPTAKPDTASAKTEKSNGPSDSVSKEKGSTK